MKKIIITITLMLVLCINTNAQDSTKIRNLTNRIELLEAYNDVLDKRFEAKSEELTNKIEYEVKQGVDKIDDQLTFIKISGGIIAAIFACGIFALLYQYFFRMTRVANKIFVEKLGHHLSENSHHIVDIITSQKAENQIKLNKKLVVIARDEEEKVSTLRLLKGMGFKNIVVNITSTYNIVNDADLIILSNMGKGLTDDLMTEFITSSGEDTTFIFYGDRFNFDRQNPHADKVNYANSKYTLYHQIINTLIFKEVFNNSMDL